MAEWGRLTREGASVSVFTAILGDFGIGRFLQAVQLLLQSESR